jgi:putative transposase
MMKLSEIGRIAEDEWLKTPEVRKNVELDTFVVMPNHVHGILVIEGAPEQDTASPCPYNRFGGSIAGSLSTIVGAYKSIVTKRVNRSRGTMGRPVWQSNYCEHIIRNEHELGRIREYIQYNPANWGQDKNNPSNWE